MKPSEERERLREQILRKGKEVAQADTTKKVSRNQRKRKQILSKQLSGIRRALPRKNKTLREQLLSKGEEILELSSGQRRIQARKKDKLGRLILFILIIVIVVIIIIVLFRH